ncbi:MAG: D-sedoheptulose 7-phosphate isomerase [Candidatus Omnitrophica bacterium]|nr:D-sedoheptulose 7-phosphate isomerase [Candidatus Omnitrophota bacterium]
MKEEILKALKESIKVKESVTREVDVIEEMVGVIVSAIKNGNKLLVFGNGGSAADAQHLVGELVGRFRMERKALNAIALSTNTSTITSIGNDYGFEYIFSRQIEGLAKKGDVCIGISTSGKASNVIAGIKMAKDLGVTTLALTGCDGGGLAKISDIALIVSSDSTPRIQEAHIAVIHIICEQVENGVFGISP